MASDVMGSMILLIAAGMEEGKVETGNVYNTDIRKHKISIESYEGSYKRKLFSR